MHLSRHRAPIASVIGALVLFMSGAAATAAPPSPVVGVALPSYHYDPSAVTGYEKALGRDVSLVQTFISWQYDREPSWSEFPAQRARAIAKTGAQLEVTWVPANPARGSDDPEFSLASIARGDHDAYIARFAGEVKRYGQPVRIRLGHEMNGSWTAYNERNSGNSAGQFAAAWRHVHEVFEGEGAMNVTWVWSPNILHRGGSDLAGLYPGDAYVDEVGIDGYSYPTAGCLLPDALFDPTLRAVRAFTAKPVRLAEVGAAKTCSNRDEFVTRLGSWTKARGVIGWTWWERSAGAADYRLVDSSGMVAYRGWVRER